MVDSNAIPDLDGAIEFSDKCNRLRTTLFPGSDGAISIIPENFVASPRDLSDTFTLVSKLEVKQVFRAINQNSAVGCDRITYATLIQHCHCFIKVWISLPYIYLFIYSIPFNVIQPMWLCRQSTKKKKNRIACNSKSRNQTSLP
jgi:hypothetical protein